MSELIWRCTFNCQQRHVFTDTVDCRQFQFQIVSTFFFLFHNFQFHITFLVALWKAKKQLFVSFSIVDRRQLSIHWLWPTDELRNAKVCWKLISNCPFSMQVSSTWNIGHKLYQPKKNKRSIQKTIFAPSTMSTNNFSFNRKWEECRKCKCGML